MFKINRKIIIIALAVFVLATAGLTLLRGGEEGGILDIPIFEQSETKLSKDMTPIVVDENSPFYEVRLTMVPIGAASGSDRKPQGDNTTAQNILMSEGTFIADPVQTTGCGQNPAMDIPCHYDMGIRYNGREVPANKRSLFYCHWWAQNLKTGAVISLGYGLSIDFTPNLCGFSFPEGFMVWADVMAFTCMAAVMYDNKYVAHNDSLLYSPVYE